MAINTALLVAPVSFQEILVDTDGSPMSGGTVTCYQDDSRTTLKNWYYQTGTAGAYTYEALPNPLTLSAAGTVCDDNGADVIPFFYPYDENDQTQAQSYYIVIANSEDTNQITRENFPYISQEQSSNFSAAAENYIINNVFWRNAGTVDLSSVTQVTLAPDQHDGFQYPDLQFFKDNTSATETVSFPSFALTTEPILTDDITPEYYLQHVCTGAASGESYKYYQFPISLHVNTLASIEFTFSIQAKSAGSTSTQNTIYAYVYQSVGTGGVSPDPFLITSMTLNSAWTKYTFSSIFPDTAGLSLSGTGDDALYLQIWMPLNSICDISFTKPSLYLTDYAPKNSFRTYDQIDAVVNSARTGDVRFSLNSFAPFGWIAANDGTIGSASSGATRANVDTWPLFNLIWSAVDVAYAPIYDSSGTASTKGSSAYDDFVANKRLSLTRALGRVLGGVGSGDGLTTRTLGQYTGVEGVTLSSSNLPPHTHTIGSTSLAQLTSGGSGVISSSGSSNSTGDGGFANDPLSVMQPSVFYNVFFKL